MRKLVTKRKIDKLLPIPGADIIELAMVGGWTCIVKKGEFKEQDIGLFFEIDSFIPIEDTRFAFLGKTKTYKDKEGYRLKTMKMRGVISQGLILPLKMFPEIKEDLEDYADILNVIKYDVSIVEKTGSVQSGTKEGKFPSFLPKTDQERLQNLMHYFEVHKDTIFEETLKLDGSSCTMYKIENKFGFFDRIKKFLGIKDINPFKFGVCSRNLELKRPSFNDKQSDFWEVVYKYNIERELPSGYAIQGELIGPKIQNNHEKVDSLEYYIFDVFDINKQEYLNTYDRLEFVDTYFSVVKHVPLIKQGVKIFEECPNLDSLQDRVTGVSMNGKGTISEGRVYKSVINPSITFKLISNKYLLKCED